MASTGDSRHLSVDCIDVFMHSCNIWVMTTSSDRAFWDDVYRGKGEFFATQPTSNSGRPGWSIGEPQPVFVELIARGKVRGEVLDAGCGHAEVALYLAALGYDVVGLDVSRTAIEEATASANARLLLGRTEFAQADITSFTGYDGRFGTIIDSTLFHALPNELREDYLRAIHRAAAPGAILYILIFTKDTLSELLGEVGDFKELLATSIPDGTELPRIPGYDLMTTDEFSDTVARHWVVDDVREVPIKAFSSFPEDAPASLAAWAKRPKDNKGRITVPGALLTAHKAK